MTSDTRLLPHSRNGWLMLTAGAVALAIAPQFLPLYYVELGTSALIAAMLALSMQVLVGATGLVSLGHGAFYGLAAYTVYLVSPESAAQPMWLTLPLAMAVAGLAAFLVGLLSIRTSGFFFLMVTLAFGQMIFFIFHDTKLGGGTDGAYLGKPLISAFGATFDLPRRQRPLGIYYVALIQLMLMYAGLALLLKTLFGRALEGIKVNEHRMRAIGYDTYTIKLIAFTLAGSLAGAAGHMWALHRGFVNPEIVGWHQSAEALLMILLGGLGSLHGPILGALALTGLGEATQVLTEVSKAPYVPEKIAALLRLLGERKLLVEGLVILAVVIMLPRGLAGIGSKRLDKSGGGHA